MLSTSTSAATARTIPAIDALSAATTAMAASAARYLLPVRPRGLAAAGIVGPAAAGLARPNALDQGQPGQRASTAPDAPAFEIAYEPLDGQGNTLAFPCDSHGEVCFAQLSERARNDYLFARACVGRLFNRPVVRPVRVPG